MIIRKSFYFILTLILFVGCTKEDNDSLKADFEFVLASERAPSEVTLVNKSVGATSYAWTFDGGYPENSDEENPLPVSYSEQGEYTITLTVSNGSTSNSVSKSFVLDEPIEIEKGLVAFYPFSGNANDGSQFRNDGNVNGAVLTKDRNEKVDSAYYFDGIDDYIQVVADENLSASNYQLSFSVWVNIEAFDNAENKKNYIFHKAKKDEQSSDWGLTYQDKDQDPATEVLRFMGDLFTPWGNGGGTYSMIGYWSEVTPELNKWYHIVVNYDLLDKEEMFINGESVTIVGNGGNTSSFWQNTANLFIGREADGGTYFNGAIDDLRIYNRILNQSEIRYLYDLTE